MLLYKLNGGSIKRRNRGLLHIQEGSIFQMKPSVREEKTHSSNTNAQALNLTNKNAPINKYFNNMGFPKIGSSIYFCRMKYALSQTTTLRVVHLLCNFVLMKYSLVITVCTPRRRRHKQKYMGITLASFMRFLKKCEYSRCFFSFFRIYVCGYPLEKALAAALSDF